MLIDMTIANFKSVKEPQTISFETVRDKRLDEAKTVRVDEKMSLVRSAAIIGPNGAGKSSAVRALEVLKFITCADPEMENPLRILAGTAFAYDPESKMEPATIKIRVVLSPEKDGQESEIAEYTIKVDSDHVYYERLNHIVGRSRRMMFERKPDAASLLAEEGDDISYTYRWGKHYRGEKKRLVKRLDRHHTFLSLSAQRGGETSGELFRWIDKTLFVLPMGVSQSSEQYLIDQLTEHPEWVEQLKNFLWSLDITDIRDIRIHQNRIIFVHTNVTQHYAAYFSTESLSLRRLCLIGVSFFESFTAGRTLVIDDFGMLLHPYVLAHIVEIFERYNNGFGSQMLVVDCNPSLLKPGLMRRDGVYFAQKSTESQTCYYSLVDFKFSVTKDETQSQYMGGGFGALPLLSEFSFQNEKEKGE